MKLTTGFAVVLLLAFTSPSQPVAAQPFGTNAIALANASMTGDVTDSGANSATAESGGGDAFAKAATIFGINGARALVQTSNSVAEATSRWTDNLEINSINPEDAGETFTAFFDYSVAGTLSVASAGVSTFQFEFTWDYLDVTTFGAQTAFHEDFQVGAGTTDININGTLEIQYREGEKSPTLSRLFTRASTAGGQTGPVESNFLGTAIFSGITLPDGHTLSSASGTVYPVPEPSHALLSFLALAAAGWRRRR